MKELIILKQETPKIEVNFQEVKDDLQIRLNDYSKLVVTEESLTFCKNEQKHLAGLRKQIDTYRKDIKNKMSVPIKEFEEKCKDLISLIEDTEKPIKLGIDVFDDARRETKREFALTEINRVCNELMLEPKYQSKIQLLPAYCNLTAKEKEVSESIYSQVELLLKEQELHQQNIKLIINALSKNDTKYEMTLKEYEEKLQYKDVISIINEIESKIEKFKKVELAIKENFVKLFKEEVKEEVRQEFKQEVQKQESIPPEVVANPLVEEKEYTHTPRIAGIEPAEVKQAPPTNTDNTMTYTLKLTGTKDKLIELRKVIVQLGIEYEIVN